MPKPLVVMLVFLACGVPYVWREPIVLLIWGASALTAIVMKFLEVSDRLKRIERAVSGLRPPGNAMPG